MFFLLKNVFSCRTGSKTHMKAMRRTIWKISGQNISLAIRIRIRIFKKKFVDPNQIPNLNPKKRIGMKILWPIL
jgi:hypothetical protein